MTLATNVICGRHHNCFTRWKSRMRLGAMPIPSVSVLRIAVMLIRTQTGTGKVKRVTTRRTRRTAVECKNAGIISASARLMARELWPRDAVKAATLAGTIQARMLFAFAPNPPAHLLRLHLRPSRARQQSPEWQRDPVQVAWRSFSSSSSYMVQRVETRGVQVQPPSGTRSSSRWKLLNYLARRPARKLALNP